MEQRKKECEARRIEAFHADSGCDMLTPRMDAETEGNAFNDTITEPVPVNIPKVPLVPPLLLDDDLLNWSRELDFDSYLESWRSMGTSQNSEGLMSHVSPRVSSLVAVDVWSARRVGEQNTLSELGTR